MHCKQLGLDVLLTYSKAGAYSARAAETVQTRPRPCQGQLNEHKRVFSQQETLPSVFRL